jgi:hypothetical protein
VIKDNRKREPVSCERWSYEIIDGVID